MATLKAKRTFKNLSDNIGKPIGEAMREAGYSEQTSKTPKRLTTTLGWQELMSKYLPDKDLAKTHNTMLKANVMVTADFSTSISDQDIKKHIKAISGSKLISIDTSMIYKKSKGGDSFETFNVKRATYTVPENNARSKGLDFAYKLKKKYNDDEDNHPNSLKLTDEQLNRILGIR